MNFISAEEYLASMACAGVHSNTPHAYITFQGAQEDAHSTESFNYTHDYSPGDAPATNLSRFDKRPLLARDRHSIPSLLDHQIPGRPQEEIRGAETNPDLAGPSYQDFRRLDGQNEINYAIMPSVAQEPTHFAADFRDEKQFERTFHSMGGNVGTSTFIPDQPGLPLDIGASSYREGAVGGGDDYSLDWMPRGERQGVSAVNMRSMGESYPQTVASGSIPRSTQNPQYQGELHWMAQQLEGRRYAEGMHQLPLPAQATSHFIHESGQRAERYVPRTADALQVDHERLPHVNTVPRIMGMQATFGFEMKHKNDDSSQYEAVPSIFQAGFKVDVPHYWNTSQSQYADPEEDPAFQLNGILDQAAAPAASTSSTKKRRHVASAEEEKVEENRNGDEEREASITCAWGGCTDTLIHNEGESVDAFRERAKGHVKSHTDPVEADQDGKYTCHWGVCEDKIGDSRGLYRHAVGEKHACIKVRCPGCSQDFSREDALKKHRKNMCQNQGAQTLASGSESRLAKKRRLRK
ncbi:hypothetical protein Hypma_004454 [Hypsizygus marmoreus]|uniref:C2H2-type domain-containing protein n=1 Tax=Hypsizygus marmoreus TaxID=39966 RepID=A0A369K3J3_HYPMA|nr:hypothetical protein Hypma_004454 [Hypsizygus marmoreus]